MLTQGTGAAETCDEDALARSSAIDQRDFAKHMALLAKFNISGAHVTRDL
jgi:hypothetical protein